MLSKDMHMQAQAFIYLFLLSSVQRTLYPLLGGNINDDPMLKSLLVSRIRNPHALKKSVTTSLHVIWKLH